jgi:hypothetical protein
MNVLAAHTFVLLNVLLWLGTRMQDGGSSNTQLLKKKEVTHNEKAFLF